MGFWDQLQSLTLSKGGGSAQDIQKQIDPIHLQKSNRHAMEQVILVNKATMRESGQPIPGTGEVQTTLIAADTTGHNTIWQPLKGEVWLVSTISVKPTASGSINLSMSLEDSTSGERAILDASTGTVTGGTIIDLINGPVYVSHECFLQAYISTNTNGVTANIAAHRVR